MSHYILFLALVLDLVGFFIVVFYGYLPLRRLKASVPKETIEYEDDEILPDDLVQRIATDPIRIALRRSIVGMILIVAGVVIGGVGTVLTYFTP